MERCVRSGGEPGGSPRFLADAMLGRLAVWLRILGYDTEYAREEDDVLLCRARDEGRILLTRDTGILRRSRLPPHLLIQSDHVTAQMRQVVRSLGLDPGTPPARRCTRCNALLEPQAKTEVAGRVPEFVWSHHDAFWGCPTCGRIYWAGSHRLRIDDTIRTLMA
jgi:uncharacterized protein